MRELELDELELVHGGYQPGSDGPSAIGMGQMGRTARAGGSSGGETFTISGVGTFPAGHPPPDTVTYGNARYTAFVSLGGWVGISADFGRSATATWTWKPGCGECH